MYLFSQFLAYGIKSKFICRENKGLCHLTPSHASVSSSASCTFLFPSTWVLVVSEYKRTSCVLHFCTFAHTVLSNTLLSCWWEWLSPFPSSVSTRITSFYESFSCPKADWGCDFMSFMSPLHLQISPWSQASHIYCLFVCLPNRL